MNRRGGGADAPANGAIAVVGQIYPLPLANSNGASAHFFTREGSLLQIALPELSSLDEATLRRGKIRAGFLKADGAILWLFQFLRSSRTPGLTFDCPFDCRTLMPEHPNLAHLESDARRMPMQIHAIDGQGVLRVSREISLPPALTRDFVAAATQQLASQRKGEAAHLLWQRRDPLQLARECEMHHCGVPTFLSGIFARQQRE